jgi:hypothetical protein
LRASAVAFRATIRHTSVEPSKARTDRGGMPWCSRSCGKPFRSHGPWHGSWRKNDGEANAEIDLMSLVIPILGRTPEWIAVAMLLASAAGITLWTAGAIYCDVCRGAKWGRTGALGWAAAVIALFAAWRPIWQPLLAFLGVTTLFLAWWLEQKPSHDRDWHSSVAVLPRAVHTEDAITIENVRNFEYRSLEDFTARFEARTYQLANLKGVDIIFFVWEIDLIGHPVLVFDFGADGRICMSIEMRLRKGQEYSVIRGLYRQQELIFLAADARDVILRRTKHSQGQQAFLYRFAAGTEELRAVFLDYAAAINNLYEKPRWYHVMCTNCTTACYQLPSARWRFDWRVLANGRLDNALYASGRLDRTLPFAELRQLAYLNDAANGAAERAFGDDIRRELERRRHER